MTCFVNCSTIYFASAQVSPFLEKCKSTLQFQFDDGASSFRHTLSTAVWVSQGGAACRELPWKSIFTMRVYIWCLVTGPLFAGSGCVIWDLFSKVKTCFFFVWLSDPPGVLVSYFMCMWYRGLIINMIVSLWFLITADWPFVFSQAIMNFGNVVHGWHETSKLIINCYYIAASALDNVDVDDDDDVVVNDN